MLDGGKYVRIVCKYVRYYAESFMIWVMRGATNEDEKWSGNEVLDLRISNVRHIR